MLYGRVWRGPTKQPPGDPDLRCIDVWPPNEPSTTDHPPGMPTSGLVIGGRRSRRPSAISGRREARRSVAMPSVEIKYGGDEEYRRLWAIRDRYGVNWRGMLLEGATFLEEHDLIGENAPSYLECTGNGDRPGTDWLEPDAAGSSAQQVNLADRDIDRIQIEIALIDSDPDPADGTETTADPDCPNDDTAAPVSAGNGDRGADRHPSIESPEAGEPDEVTSTAGESTDGAEHTANSSPGAAGRGVPARDTRQRGGHRPPHPPTRPRRAPGRGNDGE